jgi:hypothetical protein
MCINVFLLRVDGRRGDKSYTKSTTQNPTFNKSSSINTKCLNDIRNPIRTEELYKQTGSNYFDNSHSNISRMNPNPRLGWEIRVISSHRDDIPQPCSRGKVTLSPKPQVGS